MDGKLIVVVDDEKAIVELLKKDLSDKGFRVRGFLDSKTFFKFLKEGKELPDLITLDLTLPGMGGLDICEKLKKTEKFSLIPVIMLSGRGGEEDKVSCLNAGADDYIVKTASLEELSARINAVLRRLTVVEEDKKVEIGGILTVDIKNYTVTVNDKKIELTPAEFKVLECLSRREGQVITRSRILEYLWGEEKVVIGRTVDVHVRHLREKLGKAGQFIKNVRGIGYRLEV